MPQLDSRERENELMSKTSAGFWVEGSPLFEELIGLMKVKADDSSTIGKLGPNDALVVIDMQRDFAPESPSNPGGGALGAPEGENIVPAIESLVEKFVAAGATVAATKDYHTCVPPPFPHPPCLPPLLSLPLSIAHPPARPIA